MRTLRELTGIILTSLRNIKTDYTVTNRNIKKSIQNVK